MKNLILENIPTVVLTVVVILLAVIVKSFRFDVFWRRCPGPWGIPFFGFYPFFRKDYYVQMAEMAKVYGDPYLLSVGGKLYLHLSSHKTWREAHITRSDCFSERCNEFNPLQYMNEDGLPFLKTEGWRLWRKFLAQSMKELGLTPQEKLEDRLLVAVKGTLNALAESKKEPIDIFGLLSMQCTETVRSLILGKKVSYDEGKKFNEIYSNGHLIFYTLGMFMYGNFARYFLLPRIESYKETLKSRKELDPMLYNILADHKSNFDPEHPKDFIDFYLREKKIKEEKAHPQAKYFTDKILVGTLKQIYGDSGHGIGCFIAAYLIYLASKLDVQNMIYNEIHREIGVKRLPDYEDRKKLPLTCSIMTEVDRMLNSIPLMTGLECSSDTTVSGVFVPKGTVALINLHAIHKDPNVYKDPERFDPERFMLDEKTKRPKEDPPMLFGVGKRACAGEALVRCHLFVYLTAIMQHFILRPCRSNSSDQNIIDVMHDDLFRLVAIPRSDSLASQLQ